MVDRTTQFAAHMDWQQLHLLSEDNPEFEIELLQLFLDDSITHMRELERAIARHDLPQVERAAHHLKGASANIGAKAMHTVAEQMEHQARQGRWDMQTALLAQLQRLLDVIQQLVSQTPHSGFPPGH